MLINLHNSAMFFSLFMSIRAWVFLGLAEMSFSLMTWPKTWCSFCWTATTVSPLYRQHHQTWGGPIRKQVVVQLAMHQTHWVLRLVYKIVRLDPCGVLRGSQRNAELQACPMTFWWLVAKCGDRKVHRQSTLPSWEGRTPVEVWSRRQMIRQKLSLEVDTPSPEIMPCIEIHKWTSQDGDGLFYQCKCSSKQLHISYVLRGVPSRVALSAWTSYSPGKVEGTYLQWEYFVGYHFRLG